MSHNLPVLEITADYSDSHRPAQLKKMFLYLFQKQRFANLAKFKASVYKIMIATDVAAR